MARLSASGYHAAGPDYPAAGMSAFDYLSVMISLLLGLALTELVNLLSSLVMHRERVRWDWIPLAWAPMIFFVILAWWWHFFRWSGYRDWTFGLFAALTCQPLLMFQVIRALLPHPREEGVLDMRQHFEHNHVLLYALGFIGQVVGMAILVMEQGLPLGAALSDWSYDAFFVILAVGIFARRRAVHVALVVCAWLAYSYVILVNLHSPLAR